MSLVPDQLQEPCVIIYGNPVDGLAVVGPFELYGDAEAYAEKKIDDGWWITNLEPVVEVHWITNLEPVVVDVHVDYPHEPGRLIDCPACEARCHCDADPGTTACVFEGPHNYGKEVEEG